jgi:protein-S-isoprenylcysteine O-methyltransferase Ste14
MRPLFELDPPMLIVLLVGIFAWRIMETILDIRTYKRLRAGARRQDGGSHTILIVLLVLGILLGVLVAFTLPATTITFMPDLFFWLGMLILYAGIALRLYAIITLGTFFTTTVATTSQQTVIHSGPYRLIRHPSYTGILMILLGFSLALMNWLSLLIIITFALLALAYRIRVEEQVLQTQLGQPYQDYMRHTKRLIPFIL